MAIEEIDSEIRREIETRLARIRIDQGIEFLLAIESGSRAWGFPSPDSDYDVRFIYLGRPQDYLTLWPIRDVIERPIVDDLDVNGWDIRKALRLLLKHNAVVAEWIASPIRYVADHPVIGSLAELADTYFNPHGYALHYASLGQNNLNRWDANANSIPAKRYFYALRPALSVRALRLDPTNRPPMRLQELMAVCDLSTSLTEEIDHLVRLKASRREAADTKRSPSIEMLIVEELGKADEVPARRNDAEFLEAANTLFRSLVLPQSSTYRGPGPATAARSSRL